MTMTLKEMFFRTVAMLVISMQVCWGSDAPKSYGPSPSKDNYQNNYEPEIQRPLAVFTEKPVNVANFVMIPVVQVPSSDLKLIYKPQIDSVSKTEPVIMCKSSSKSFEATPAVLVPLQQPFYLYDERTLIPFPKTVTILHGGYRMSIPVGVVVAPVPVGVLRAGPVLVTTLYAIPVSPVLVPSIIRFVPVTSNPSPPQYSNPPSPPKYPNPPPSPPKYSNPPPSPPKYSNPPSPPKYSNPSPPPPKYSHPAAAPESSSPPVYSHPSPPAYSYPSPPHLTLPAYSPPPAYPQHPSPPGYSLPAPPEPTYYQHGGGGGEYGDGDSAGGSDLRNRDPPGQLYSHYVADPPQQPQQPQPQPFYNSKESPVLQQLRDEAEKDRHKYAVPPPSYSVQYQVPKSTRPCADVVLS